MKCPACNSELNGPSCELGSLGNLRWYRCRYCGMDFSKVKKSVPPRKLKSVSVQGGAYVVQ